MRGEWAAARLARHGVLPDEAARVCCRLYCGLLPRSLPEGGKLCDCAAHAESDSDRGALTGLPTLSRPRGRSTLSLPGPECGHSDGGGADESNVLVAFGSDEVPVGLVHGGVGGRRLSIVSGIGAGNGPPPGLEVLKNQWLT